MLEGRKAVDSLPCLPLRQAQIIKALEIEPEFRARAEEMGKAQSGVAGDGPLSLQNRRNAVRRHVELPRELGGAHAEFVDFFFQVFAGVYRCLCHKYFLQW